MIIIINQISVFAKRFFPNTTVESKFFFQLVCTKKLLTKKDMRKSTMLTSVANEKCLKGPLESREVRQVPTINFNFYLLFKNTFYDFVRTAHFVH